MTSSSKTTEKDCRLVIVGSVGIDTIETPREKRERILGGSASYACAAASFFVRTGMVGVVGTDFSNDMMNVYRAFGIDLAGLQVKPGNTFHWSGVYEANMDHRRTLATELNVFATFNPELPEPYRDAPFLFLANISPELQLHVLEQVHSPKFILLDTMDLWINVAREKLIEVIGKVSMLMLNESEARHLTGEHSLLKAAQHLLDLGPRYLCIKKGENGSVLFDRKNIFMVPAFPLEDVQDPTGAGDTFAGGFIGALARNGDITEENIRKAMTYGAVVASFGVEKFSLERLQEISVYEIEERAGLFRSMATVI